MALQLDDLSSLAYADGFTLWHYRSSTDTQAGLAAPGYFAAASHMLRQGDMVLARASDGFALLYMSGSGTGLTATAF
jgi:hypothetical protein